MPTRNTLGQEVLDGIFEFAFEQYDSIPQVYPLIFDVQNSTKAYETGTDFTMDSAIEIVDEGDASRESKVVPGYTWGIANRKIMAKAKITREAIEDGRISYQEIGAELGRKVAYFEDEHAHKIFNYGALTAGNEIFDYSIGGVITDPNPLFIYDGLPFFDTAHTITTGDDTFANHTATLALSSANLITVLNTMENTNAVDNANRPVMIKADTLFVPSSLRFTAMTILNSTLMPGGMLNDTNVLNGALRVVESRWLSDSDGWFVGAAKQGIKWYNRSPLQINAEWDNDHQVWWVYLSKRVGVGVTNWRYWYGANISAT